MIYLREQARSALTHAANMRRVGRLASLAVMAICAGNFVAVVVAKAEHDAADTVYMGEM
jgi:hypothetical protein